MKTTTCHAASNNRLALTEEGRVALHHRCDGYVQAPAPSTEVELCDCECHKHRERPSREEAHVHPAAPDAGDWARDARSDRKKPEKGAGEGCECGCGGATKSRFLPGHDAKLKSRLTREAREGSVDAYYEILERDWEHIVSTGKVPLRVIISARRRAKERGVGPYAN